MAGDRLYKQKFIFSDNTIVEKYVWESDILNNNIDKFPERDGEISQPYWEEAPVESNYPSIMVKMNPNQIRAERMKRSTDHFKREVFDTLPKEDKMLFRDRPDLAKRLK